MKLLIATHNLHKIDEFKQYFKNTDIEVEFVDDDVDIEETGSTIEENAYIKARYYFDKYHMSVIGDDTGLFVEALDGKPGVASARFAKNHDSAANRQKLISLLTGVTNRSAYMASCICLIDEEGNSHNFIGKLSGEILSSPQGSSGFGYDSIFMVKEINKTLAEITMEEKNRISHRGKAALKLVKYLTEVK